MANGRGYLGKISAIVSANTGDYVRKLDDSAKRTAAFARTIQSDLKKASQEASRSLDGILTPLQRVERALQNARSQRLSFRGFDGAIRTVEDLRKRIGSLDLGDRELAVRVSGLRSIDALNKAIEGLKQEDIDLAVRVGGVEGLQRLRQQVKDVNGESINVSTGRSAANLDFIISKLQTISAQRIQQVQIAVETAQLDRAELAFKRTVAVATQIAAPLSAAVNKITSLSASVQVALGPSLQSAQQSVEELNRRIEKTGGVSARSFSRASRLVDGFVASTDRLAQAESVAARIRGATRSFDNTTPQASDALRRAAEAAESSASAPSFIRSRPEVRQSLAELEAATERLLAIQVRYENAVGRGESGARQARALAQQAAEVTRLTQSYQSLSVAAGLPEFEQVSARANAALGAFKSLDAGLRSGLSGLADSTRLALGALERTGVGAVALAADITRLEQATNAAAFGQNIRTQFAAVSQSLSDVTGTALSRLSSAVGSALEAFGLLPERLRQQLIPSLGIAISEAARLGEAVSVGAVSGTAQIDRLAKRAKDLADRFRDISSLSSAGVDGLFRAPRDVRSVSELNQSVLDLDQRFRQLPASARGALVPFVSEVKRAAAAVESARLADASKRDISALVTQYRAAVRALEAVSGEVARTGAAFASATPASRLTAGIDSLRARYESLGDSASKTTRELLALAAAQVAAAQAPSASPTARTRARQGLQVAGEAVQRDERLQRVAQIFQAPSGDTNALLAEADRLIARYNDLPLAARRAAQQARDELQRAARNAADTDQATTRSALARQLRAFGSVIEPDVFGKPVDDATRRLGVLQGALNSVKGQIDQLSIPIQAKFVPLLAQAEQQFKRLSNSGAATAAEIAKAAKNVESLKNSVSRAADAGKILSAAQAKAAADTARSLGEVSAAGRLLTVIGANPGDAASKAYDRLAAATRRYVREGTTGTAEVRKELQGLQLDLSRAAASTGRITVGNASRLIQRGGDVATGSFNNAGLAAQQALFIFDDFFSVTGDFTQRIRAIGNNITQLGLIVGQTRGLFIALGISLGLQATAQLVKFFNAGVTGAEKSRGLNEALQRQKTAVDQLAESFRNLSRSFTLDAFQGGARSTEEFRRQVEALRKQQQEAARERAASLDPAVDRERAIQQARRRDLESVRNPGQVVALQREIEQSLARERLAAARASSRQAVPTEQVISRLAAQVEQQQAVRRISQSFAADPESFAPGIGGPALAAAQNEAQRQSQLFADELRAQIRAGTSLESVIRQRIDDLTSSRRNNLFSGDDISLLERQLQEAASLLVDVQKDRVRAEEEAGIRVIESLREFGFGVSRSQEAIEEAITRGVPGAIEFSKRLNDSAKAVQAAEDEFTNAIADRRAAEALPQETLNQRNVRNEAVAAATQRRDAAQRQIQAAQRQARELISRGLDFRLASAGIADRAGSALQTLQSSQEFANEYAGLTAQLQSAIERERFAREQAGTSNNAATQAQLKAAQAATQLAAAAANAAIAVNKGFERFRVSVQSFAQETQRAADDAQDRVNRASNVGGPPLAELEQDRDRINQSLDSDRQFVRGIENQIQAAVAGLQDNAAFRRLSGRVNELNAQRDAAAALAIQTGILEDPRVTARRTAEIAKAEQQLDEIRKSAEEGIRRQAEGELRIRNARNRREAFLRTLQEQTFPSGDSTQGLDALRTSGDRARVQLERQFANIASAVNDLRGIIDPAELDQRNAAAQRRAVEQVTELGLSDQRRFERGLEDSLGSAFTQAAGFLDPRINDRQAAIDSLNNVQRNLSRQNAPLFAQFSDEVANAVLQGPSRAALQVSDASTSEGQRELNRLLRGDDAARDVNLVELQKQSTFLQSIDSGIAALKDQLGIAQ